MFPPVSEDLIPDKYLTSSSFKIHSFPVPLLLNSNNFIHVISQYLKKYWGHFSDLLIFLVTLKQEKEYLDQNFLFSSSFRKSLWLLGEFSSCISSTFVGESDSSIIFPGEQNGILARFNICDALRYLVPFAQFKKRKKHPWRSDTFNKVAITKSITPPRFQNCTNGTKSHSASHFKIISQYVFLQKWQVISSNQKGLPIMLLPPVWAFPICSFL